MIKIKNIKQIPEKEDGFRIFMGTSWPEEISKEELQIDLCLNEIAPSPKLCQCFKQNPHRWLEFKESYREELKSKKMLISIIRDMEKEKGTITLVYTAENDDQNGAVVLREKLQGYKTVYTPISRIHG
jgi:uncharacterized protein YeaO (DUF488 family)